MYFIGRHKSNARLGNTWRYITEDEKPTPCPFCRCMRDDDEQHSIWLELHSHSYLIDGIGLDTACWVHCPVCEANGPVEGTPEDAIKAWKRGWKVLEGYINILCSKPVGSEVVGLTFEIQEGEHE